MAKNRLAQFDRLTKDMMVVMIGIPFNGSPTIETIPPKKPRVQDPEFWTPERRKKHSLAIRRAVAEKAKGVGA